MIRASGSYIKGSGGTSNGLVPMLRVFDNTARYVDQGGGKRKGAFAMYLEPWHADVESFLELKKNHGKEEARARDLFYALWIPDLFMKRIEEGGDWSLFCPNECPGLCDTWGEGVRGPVRQVRGGGEARARRSRRRRSGSPSSTRSRRRGRRTSCTRTRPTASRTSRTSARSAARTCAPRSSSTRRPRRWPSATSRRSRCRASSSTAPSTTRSCTTSRTSSRRTSTA